MKKFSLLVFLGIIIFSGCVFQKKNASEITNFAGCVSAGYPVMESFPRQCKTPEGKIFAEEMAPQEKSSDQIRVTSPQKNEVIKSPLEITGEARGPWFFEASFPIQLVDDKGNLIIESFAEAQGNWMTENFVPFVSKLEFSVPTGITNGELILKKDNPSGLPENDAEIRIPVRFSGE
ncbi:hypothetical protein HZA38_01780 [Candidatus Peregrinibacteria bacterium]|nr:hypothetical protein [Candidatus Peregrinibacteria bacterium]